MQPITLRAGLEPKLLASRLCAAVKLQVRAWAHPALTRRRLNLLNSVPALCAIAHLQPRLLHKIYRPYLSTRLCAGERLAVLEDHYRFILRHSWAPLVAAATQEVVTLASFVGRSGTRYQLTLRAIVPMEREGELILQLRSGTAVVQSVAFSFVVDRELDSVAVGCLQGPQSGHGLALARAATRDLYGMRPKQLLVRLLQSLGYAYGCQQLLMVGNGSRPVQKQLRQGHVHANYDGFWSELDARRRDDGDFVLHCSPPQAPSMEHIASKKRAEARRRYALLTDLAGQVTDRLALPRPTRAVSSGNGPVYTKLHCPRIVLQ